MIEVKNIKIKRFRDEEGSPTCSKNILKKQYCPFLRTANFGTIDLCCVTNKNLRRRLVEEEKTGIVSETGSVIPCEGCIVWTKRELK